MILLRSGPKVISIPSKHRVQKLVTATIRTFNNVRETPYPPTPPPPPPENSTQGGDWRKLKVAVLACITKFAPLQLQQAEMARKFV